MLVTSFLSSVKLIAIDRVERSFGPGAGVSETMLQETSQPAVTILISKAALVSRDFILDYSFVNSAAISPNLRALTVSRSSTSARRTLAARVSSRHRWRNGTRQAPRAYELRCSM